jgi:hypothetical protein
MTGFKHIVEFLESGNFKDELFAACKDFEILSEADLQVFVCRKLIHFISITPTLQSKYRVNAEPFCRELNFYPDIAIFRRRAKVFDQPAFAIELKEGHSFGNAVEHDCTKLRQCRSSISVRRAYLIHVVHAGRAEDFYRTLASQKKGLKNIVGIPVVMEQHLPDEYGKWHQQRRKLVDAFKTKYKPGKQATAAIAG